MMTNQVAHRWQAVLDRDRRSDGRFVFAVRSTGIYCRPSCPARRPRPVNVVFFTRPEEAEGAGFRACRRCHPRDAARDAALVERACRVLDAEDDGALRLDVLAGRVGAGPRTLVRAFRNLLGVTPRQYAEARRLAGFKRRLKEGRPVTGALYDAGYGSSSRLYEDVHTRLGMTPAVYRRGSPGVAIRYTTADSPLGRLLVAATERGIAAVSLGDSDRALEESLHKEHPSAEIARDDGALSAWVRAVLALLAGAEPAAELPVDVRATAFQHRVWRELARIPRGQTRSYEEVARRIGRPTAARAVARACSSNRLALVIPCHRVVAKDGELGGYRWGVARKKALLEAEAARPRVEREVSRAGGRRR